MGDNDSVCSIMVVAGQLLTFPSLPIVWMGLGDANSREHTVFTALPSPHTLFPCGKSEGGQTKGFFRFHVL